MAFRASRLSKTNKLFSVTRMLIRSLFDGQAVMPRSHRLEFGVERVLDNSSNIEATAFFDTTTGRGVGCECARQARFKASDAFLDVANQQGSSRGIRVVYTRRLNRVWSASAGYAFGRGQQLAEGFQLRSYSKVECFKLALQFAAGIQ